MTAIERAVPSTSIIPEDAPFTESQRSWLNGFFAGLLSIDASSLVARSLELSNSAQGALSDGDDDDPWHDPAMPIEERMELADGRPLKSRLYASMAQQDCGQCGYLCESYADALFSGSEQRANLCVPGGKETSRMLKKLLEETSAEEKPKAIPPTTSTEGELSAKVPGYDREQPLDAAFVSATRLSRDGSEKETYHVVFDIQKSGIEYEPGDSFGVCPRNDPALVELVLEAMRAPAEFPISGKALKDCLLEDYDLGTAPDMLFELASYMVGGRRRQKAKALAKGEDPDGDADTYDVLKVVTDFGPMHPDPEAFLECLDPLQPRLYSISSSQLATPGEVHLTVDAVRYNCEGRERLGVASTFLTGRMSGGQDTKVYIQKAHNFSLPDELETPVIMVGPGTGIAPFRSFLLHRSKQKCSGSAWLFYGHQRERTDFFYQDELEQFQKTHVLTKLSTAWSRDGQNKVYVQDRMREEGEEIWKWMSEGAHFYICGDATRMARDVEAALRDIVVTHAGIDEAAATNMISTWKSSGQFQTDVY